MSIVNFIKELLSLLNFEFFHSDAITSKLILNLYTRFIMLQIKTKGKKMKLKTTIVAFLAIISSVNLFGADLESITKIVDDINESKDVKERAMLMDKLEEELVAIDKSQLPETQKIVSKIFITE